MFFSIGLNRFNIALFVISVFFSYTVQAYQCDLIFKQTLKSQALGLELSNLFMTEIKPMHSKNEYEVSLLSGEKTIANIQFRFNAHDLFIHKMDFNSNYSILLLQNTLKLIGDIKRVHFTLSYESRRFISEGLQQDLASFTELINRTEQLKSMATMGFSNYKASAGRYYNHHEQQLKNDESIIISLKQTQKVLTPYYELPIIHPSSAPKNKDTGRQHLKNLREFLNK